MIFLFRFATIIFATLLGVANGGAMSVAPTQIELKSAGDASRAQIVVQNTSAVPLPVEAVVQRLTIDENGKRQVALDEASFLVFPPQTIIPPGGSQVFRITWMGEPLLDRSQSFLLTMAQLPVRQQETANTVHVVMAFGVVINVAPPTGDGSLQVVSSGVVADGKGQLNPVVTVWNPSTVHALLPNATIRLTSPKWSQTLTPSVIGQKVGIGLVPPGKRRRFVLPIVVPPGVGGIKATIDYVPAKK